MLNNVFGMTPVGSVLAAASNVDPPANSGNRAAMSGTRTTTVQVDGAMVMGGVGVSPTTGVSVFGGAGVFSANVTETQQTWGAGADEFMANVTENPHTRGASADVLKAKVTETKLTRGAKAGTLTASVTETQTQLTRRAIGSSKITKVLCVSDTPRMKRALE